MRLLKQLMVSVMLLTLALESTAYAVDINQKDPEVMVKELSETVVSEVDKQRAELETDPQKVKALLTSMCCRMLTHPKWHVMSWDNTGSRLLPVSRKPLPKPLPIPCCVPMPRAS